MIRQISCRTRRGILMLKGEESCEAGGVRRET